MPRIPTSKNWQKLLLAGAAGVAALGVLTLLLSLLTADLDQNAGTYAPLPADTSTEEPLAYLNEDFTVKEGFHSNLPLVVLRIDGELAEYKSFSVEGEQVDEGVQPYTGGTITVIDGGGENTLTDAPVATSAIEIKKRGHTSFTYDKPQYLLKTVDETGENRDVDFLGMGADNSWVLNGSMADKSMIRNYLPYRIASEIDGNNMAPDSRFCEVLLQTDAGYEYRGVYLLTEAVSRGESRVDIEGYREKNVYSGYIVRRDRFTNFDPMLETYGRLNGFAPEWIGLKYPSAAKATPQTLAYIQKDFSRMEEVLYAEDAARFQIYDKYIDVDSFVDYFLINEYFGNYDAGEHSTYLYKNPGETLHIGPVWDFDQAMNNYFADEMDPLTLAFQEKPLYDRLTTDVNFLEKLKDRYSELQKNQLSEAHVMAVIDETVAYLKSARAREWYRWAADYEDGSFENPHNYYLQDYLVDGEVISRFNDTYEQELYNIKTYLHRHGLVIQEQLTVLERSATQDTSWKNRNTLLLLMVMTLFLVPSYLISRRG